MSELNNKLLEIKRQKDEYIIPENLKKDVTAFGVTGTYEGSGGSGDVKLFETRQEMIQDTSAPEGSLAILYKDDIQPILEDTEFDSAIFTNLVTLDSSYSGSVTYSFRSIDHTIMFDAMCDISSTSFRFNYYMDNGSGETISGEITYTSEDGITYTRTDGGEELVEFGTTIKFESWGDPFDDILGSFIKVSGKNFGGLYQYITEKDNSYYATITGVTVDTTNMTAEAVNEQVYLPQLDNIYKILYTNITEYELNRQAIILQNKLNHKYYITTYRSGLYFETLYRVDNSKLGLVIKTESSSYSGELPTQKLFEFDIQTGEVISTLNETSYIGARDNESCWLCIDINNYNIIAIKSEIYGEEEFGICVATDISTPYRSNVTQLTKNHIECLAWHNAKTQFNLQSSNQLLPNITALGQIGSITGDGSIYNNLDNDKLFVDMMGLNKLVETYSSSTNTNIYGTTDKECGTSTINEFGKFTKIKLSDSYATDTLFIKEDSVEFDDIKSQLPSSLSSDYSVYKCYYSVKYDKSVFVLQKNAGWTYYFAIVTSDGVNTDYIECSTSFPQGSSLSNPEVYLNDEIVCFYGFKGRYSYQPLTCFVVVNVNTLNENVVLDETSIGAGSVGSVVFSCCGDYIAYGYSRGIGSGSNITYPMNFYFYQISTNTLMRVFENDTSLFTKSKYFYGNWCVVNNHNYYLLHITDMDTTPKYTYKFFMYDLNNNTYNLVTNNTYNNTTLLNISGNVGIYCLEDNSNIYDYTNGYVYNKTPDSNSNITKLVVNNGKVLAHFNKYILFQDENNKIDIITPSDTPNYRIENNIMLYNYNRLVCVPSNGYNVWSFYSPNADEWVTDNYQLIGYSLYNIANKGSDIYIYNNNTSILNRVKCKSCNIVSSSSDNYDLTIFGTSNMGTCLITKKLDEFNINIPSSINVLYDRESDEVDVTLPDTINWSNILQLVKPAIKEKNGTEWHYSDWEDPDTGELVEMKMEISSQYDDGEGEGGISNVIGLNEDDGKYHFNLSYIYIYNENYQDYDFKLVVRLMNNEGTDIYGNKDIIFNVTVPDDVFYDVYVINNNISQLSDVTISIKDTNNNDIPYTAKYNQKYNGVRIQIYTKLDGTISITYNGNTETRTLDTQNNLENEIYRQRFQINI